MFQGVTDVEAKWRRKTKCLRRLNFGLISGSVEANQGYTLLVVGLHGVSIGRLEG